MLTLCFGHWRLLEVLQPWLVLFLCNPWSPGHYWIQREANRAGLGGLLCWFGGFFLLFGELLCFGCCFLVHLCESMSKQTETLSRECHTLKCRDANPNIASHCQIQKLVASCMSFEVQGCASMECISIQKSDGSYSDSDSNNDLLAVNLTVFGHT